MRYVGKAKSERAKNSKFTPIMRVATYGFFGDGVERVNASSINSIREKFWLLISRPMSVGVGQLPKVPVARDVHACAYS
jgi:hypothetical protein